MTFEQWKAALAIELERVFGMKPNEGAKYIADTGDDAWRPFFDDGMTPADAAAEEALSSTD